MGGTQGCPHAPGAYKEGCWGCYSDLEEQNAALKAEVAKVQALWKADEAAGIARERSLKAEVERKDKALARIDACEMNQADWTEHCWLRRHGCRFTNGRSAALGPASPVPHAEWCPFGIARAALQSAQQPATFEALVAKLPELESTALATAQQPAKGESECEACKEMIAIAGMKCAPCWEREFHRIDDRGQG